VFSEVINWDEFALLDRAARTLHSGTVDGGSRPGLVTILLIPFVRDCVDAVYSVVNARLLWQIVTTFYLVGVFFLVRRWFAHSGRPREGLAQGLLAVGLLAFLPAFVVWSIQVRTDQAALAAAAWGGVLLLSTSHWRAAAAGVLFAISLLSTQKGLYPIALSGLLFATSTIARLQLQPANWRAELLLAGKRVALACLAAGAAVAVYLALVPEASTLASQGSLMSALETMRFTRASQGFRIYTVHATRLVVHWALFLVLVAWTLRVLWNRDKEELPLIATSWLSLALGLAVIAFHGSSFPYFIMTAGLFPALALAMTAGRPIALAGRSAWTIVVVLVVFAAMQGARESIQMLQDTQWEQRETLRLVYDSPLRERRGYQVEGALFCMNDPDPLPVLFSAGIHRRFRQSPVAERNTEVWIKEFRDRPVAYIVDSYRLWQFPPAVREFWSEHYIWYARSLYLVGYNISEARDLDVIVGGVYRWDADIASPQAGLRLNGLVFPPGAEIELKPGSQRAEALGEGARGQLILADLPRPERDGYPFFYLRRQIYQLGGRF
jgi:hypothetical protein